MSSKSGFALITVLAVGGAFVVPCSALGQEAERNAYFAIKGGPYFPTVDNPFTAIGQSVETWPTKYAVDLALGGYWGIFGLQLSAGYLTTGDESRDFKAWPVLAIARARLPIGPVGPYVEGGAGIAISSLKGVGTETSTKVAFEAVGGFGLDVYLGPLLLGAEAKYMWLNPEFTIVDSTTGQEAVQSLKFNGIIVQAYVGYRW
jgi:hypothetical protein